MEAVPKETDAFDDLIEFSHVPVLFLKQFNQVAPRFLQRISFNLNGIFKFRIEIKANRNKTNDMKSGSRSRINRSH